MGVSGKGAGQGILPAPPVLHAHVLYVAGGGVGVQYPPSPWRPAAPTFKLAITNRTVTAPYTGMMDNDRCGAGAAPEPNADIATDHLRP